MVGSAHDVCVCVAVARRQQRASPQLGRLAAERRALREAQRRHHPPGTVPEEARANEGLRFKETQVRGGSINRRLLIGRAPPPVCRVVVADSGVAVCVPACASLLLSLS
eukprot:COSAG01_NODE_35183_length_535_cov_3.801262_1_plen_108_part_10